jgi:hypothetical protein
MYSIHFLNILLQSCCSTGLQLVHIDDGNQQVQPKERTFVDEGSHTLLPLSCEAWCDTTNIGSVLAHRSFGGPEFEVKGHVSARLANMSYELGCNNCMRRSLPCRRYWNCFRGGRHEFLDYSLLGFRLNFYHSSFLNNLKSAEEVLQVVKVAAWKCMAVRKLWRQPRFASLVLYLLMRKGRCGKMRIPVFFREREIWSWRRR